ncbi:glycosyltransferase family 2 protein [Reyranella aquatilis]|uniref:Glycosyltransferase family 2 protein n=1 Tax=Reyranella aquatilis TaxID=2035356 RepID=A0ABS8L065_9HYPH|nr:glycosyltransferase family 2 protein [Reyranella aquatilis]MCC8431721.1 glycosyltransferase family 2 protein [Reyranella aquatilis]
MQFDIPAAVDTSAGGWLRLRYQMALCRSAARPVIRFDLGGEEIQVAMGAGLFGAGEWVGPIPLLARHVRIALPPGLPATGFSLTSCEVLAFPKVLALAGRRSVFRTIAAAGLRLLGRRADAVGLLEETLNATPMSRYHEWRTSSERPLDPQGLDASEEGLREGPHLRVLIGAEGGRGREMLAATLASLRRQPYANWSLFVVGDAVSQAGDPPWTCIEGSDSAARLWAGLESTDLVLPILAGDTVPDFALATLAGFALSHPGASLFYADEDSVTTSGRYVAPELKPDWSPILQNARAYVGRAVYFRRHGLEGQGLLSAADFMRPLTWNGLFARERGPVGHIRRVLLTKRVEAWRPDEAVTAIPARTPVAEQQSTATLIVPTRDHADLLAVCLASLGKTSPDDLELVIVDNGSEQPAALELLEQFRKKPNVRVLDAPGPFNFASLCNRGAALAHGSVLVFLNNDTEVFQPEWLSRLVRWAVQPDIGAVGPKLVYGSGRVQHAGLVLSLGGYAAHIDAGASPAEEGYLGRLSVPHEVSAVTGACLAVEKEKFDAVGGFDAKKYPIELGDVDLCLRLAERGWKSVFTPEAVLIHRESASRGKTAAKRYAWERRHFQSDWKDVLADDPYFHPALSLAALRTSLDR